MVASGQIANFSQTRFRPHLEREQAHCIVKPGTGHKTLVSRSLRIENQTVEQTADAPLLELLYS